jgi:hypothetical protein
MSRRAVVFLHIPKTGGTTLNRIIEWQYSPLSIFTVDPFRVRATVERFKRFPERRRLRYKVVRGHLHYGIHDYLPQGADYITLLREPAARVLSSYYFILRRPLHPLHRKLKTGRVGVEEFLRLTAHRQNLQCRFIAGLNRGAPCDETTLAVAMENLHCFRIVGLCERFDESLSLMMQCFGWRVGSYQNWKVAKWRPALDSGVLDMIREQNRFDVQLYKFAKELFSAQLSAAEVGALQFNSNSSRASSLVSSSAQFYRSAVGLGRFLISKVGSAI